MPAVRPQLATRRAWMRSTLLTGSVLAAGANVECGRSPAGDPFRGGSLIGNLPFEDEGQAPFDTLLGDELDGRLFTDLSQLAPDRMLTPIADFYIRTRASHLLDLSRPWTVRIQRPGGVAKIGMDELKAQAEPRGRRLMECAGNTRAARFAMLSVASWDGVPLARLLDKVPFDPHSPVLVSGFDEYSAKPVTPSIPGCSWIFSRAQIEESGAFLAIAMNGQPLPPDHGAPVRLVLPGWYGCACVKWVNEIRPVNASAPPTSQMQEYAARTQQVGLPVLAADYLPAVIDPAAMPVRVEQWRVDGKSRYKVVGVVWGGPHPARDLEIRFRADDPYAPVAFVEPAGPNPWSLWMHPWMPREPGVYRIRLRLADSSVRTRRLDTGFYVRQVRIEAA